MTQRSAVLLPLVIAWIPAVASAQGKIVFANGGHLYQQGDDGKGEATQLAGLSDDATEVRFVEATVDGKLIAIDMGPSATWWRQGEGVLDSGPCVARARPSPKGECLVCPGLDSAVLVSADGQISKGLAVQLREVQFRGTGGTEMAGLTDDEVIGFDRKTPDKTQALAKNQAKSHLLVAPDGKRAVAVFGEGATSRIKAFLLDGKGAARQLGGPGVPVAWSWDSEWIITQEGINPDEENGEDDDDSAEVPADAHWLPAAPKGNAKKKEPPPAPKGPTTRACAVRATGGETKCWDGYHGLAFSPDSTRVLLKKGTTLYVGKIAGVRPEPPVKLIDNVDGAATWIP